jgi:hypothetical protein
MSVRVCDRVTILLTVVFVPHAHFSSGQPCRSIARLDAHSRVFTVRVRVAKVTVAASARDTASAGAPNAPTVRSRAILAVKPGRIAPPFTG